MKGVGFRTCVSSSIVVFPPVGVTMEVSGLSFRPSMCTEMEVVAVREGLLGKVMEGSSGRPTTNGPGGVVVAGRVEGYRMKGDTAGLGCGQVVMRVTDGLPVLVLVLVLVPPPPPPY